MVCFIYYNLILLNFYFSIFYNKMEQNVPFFYKKLIFSKKNIIIILRYKRGYYYSKREYNYAKCKDKRN